MDRQRYQNLIDPAIVLVIKKGQDYNSGHNNLSDYFPFGMTSYAQMIHVKSMRFVSLAKLEARSIDKPNYESARDTLLDLINYCVFALDALQPKPDPAMNMYGKSNEKL